MKDKVKVYKKINDKGEKEWFLYINEKDYSEFIPKKLKYTHMNTFGRYYKGMTEDDSLDYYDGLKEKEWIKENKKWLDKITKDQKLQSLIFEEIQFNDFRPNFLDTIPTAEGEEADPILEMYKQLWSSEAADNTVE